MNKVTATNPNGKLSQEEAIDSLYKHPQFPKGARLASIKRVKGLWESTIEVPKSKTAKTAAPAFLDDEGPESDEGPPKPPSDDKLLDDALDEPDDSDSDDGDKEPKLSDLLDLVKAVADKLGVHPDGEKDDLDEELPGDEEVPLHPPHGEGPPGGPPHPPGKPGGLKPGMAPPGTTPVGAPAFASTNDPITALAQSVATFNTEPEVTNMPLAEAERQINAKYQEHGFKVKKLQEGTNAEGRRTVRAQVSCR